MDPRYDEPSTTTYVSQVAEASKLVKTGAGKAYTIDIVNVAAADRFCWAFDAVALAGTVAFPPFKIPAGGFISIEWRGPLQFGTGLMIGSSTTQAAFAAGGADFMMRVRSK